MPEIPTPEVVQRPRWRRLLGALAAEDYAEWVDRMVHEAVEEVCEEAVHSGAA